MPYLWKPAFSSFSCEYPNDADAKFCQSCGFKFAIDEDEFSASDDLLTGERLRYLDSLVDCNDYNKKTSSLEKEFVLYSDGSKKIFFPPCLMILDSFWL